MRLPSLLAALVVAPVVIGTLAVHASAPPIHSGEWLHLHGPEMHGRSHAIQIAYVSLIERTPQAAWFTAVTSDRETTTGRVRIAVRLDQVAIISTRYGTYSQFMKAPGYPSRKFEGVVLYDPATKTASMIEADLVPILMAADPGDTRKTSVRTWTSSDGRTIDAIIVSASSTTVTIRRMPDRTEFTIGLDRLSALDRAYVVDWLRRQGG